MASITLDLSGVDLPQEDRPYVDFEIVDDELTSVGRVWGASGAIGIQEPGRYGAILRLPDGRTLRRGFSVAKGVERVTVKIEDARFTVSSGVGHESIEPAGPSSSWSNARPWPWLLALVILPAVMVGGAWLVVRSGLIEPMALAPTQSSDRGSSDTSLSRIVERLRETSAQMEIAGNDAALRLPPVVEHPSAAGSPEWANPEVPVERKSDIEVLKPLPRTTGRGGPPPSQVGAMESVWVPLLNALGWLGLASGVVAALVRIALPYLPRLLSMVMRHYFMAAASADDRRAEPWPAEAKDMQRHARIPDSQPGPPPSGAKPPSQADGVSLRNVISSFDGFDLVRREPNIRLQVDGRRFDVVRAEEAGGGLWRIDTFCGDAGNGVAVILPLAGGEKCSVEIRQRSGRPHHAHLIFADPDLENMLGYRRDLQLDVAVRIGGIVADRQMASARIDRPIALAVGLYFLLRAGSRPVSDVAPVAARLVEEHGWLPDAHILAGEISARRADHVGALASFLELSRLGPPFATAGVSYLSDRLRLYAAHGDTLRGIKSKEEVDLFATTVSTLTDRMIANRPLTTFVTPANP